MCGCLVVCNRDVIGNLSLCQTNQKNKATAENIKEHNRRMVGGNKSLVSSRKIRCGVGSDVDAVRICDNIDGV